MSEQRRVGRGAIWSMANAGVGQLLALMVFFVTARFVSKADFGIMAICFLVIELFKQVAIESFATAITVRDRPEPRDFDTCFVAILITSAVAAALTFALAGAFAALLHNPAITRALRLISLLLLTTGLSRTHEAWMTRRLEFRALAIRSTVSIVIGGGVGIALAVEGYGLTALIAQQLVTALVSTVALWSAASWVPRLKTTRAELRGIWNYARHVGLTGLTNFANTQSDTFFASYYLGAAATGVYNAAKRILYGINGVVATALLRVALPTFANLRGEPERMRQAFLRAVSFTSTITAPIFAGLIVTSPDVIAIAMGPKWAEVASVLSLIAVNAYITTIGQYNQSVMLVHDKPHWQTILTGIYAISNIALFIVVVRYGLTALAIGYSARAILLYPMQVGGALHLLRLDAKTYLGRLVPTIGAATAMALVIVLFRRAVPIEPTLLRLIGSVLVGAASYCAALWLLGRRDLREFVAFSHRVVHAG